MSTVDLEQGQYSRIILSAVRYAIGRRTYTPSCVCDQIRENMDFITEDTAQVIIELIDEEETHGDLGADCDVRTWTDIRYDLQNSEHCDYDDVTSFSDRFDTWLIIICAFRYDCRQTDDQGLSFDEWIDLFERNDLPDNRAETFYRDVHDMLDMGYINDDENDGLTMMEDYFASYDKPQRYF